ncbi:MULTISPECIES: putative Ig domain-containing protein [unclassified Afipia]|uniref:putative Ig domain-containing protein n=1 Tax=unclassified Afipia TaxID=2642050 RepID=UPI001FCB9141|nr:MULTISPECIES: putative Ig domain-containing protein [unclassified Afipia]
MSSNLSMQGLAGTVVSDGFVFAANEIECPAVCAPAVFVDAGLLFSGHYDRVGLDLVISSGPESFTVHEYFKGEYRASLMSPEGASLAGRVIEAMTARVQYVQADQIASAVAAVGNVAKVSGTAVVTRSGVPVELKQGDRLLKGDVVQTGPDTTIGISFVDGTALGLASNARIVLDEMTYDPNGSSNSSLLSLIQGTITLVAGHTAKFGNMRVETPVATMGIRGTAVMVEIVSDDGPSKFSVLKEPDGKIGSFHLYDKGTGELLKVVSHAGLVTIVTPLGAGQPVSAIDQLKTLADIQSERGLIQQVFQIYYPNYNPNGPGGDKTGSSVNPLANFAGISSAQGIESGVPGLIALASGVVITPALATPQDLLIFPDAPPAPAVRAIAVANVVDVQASQGPVERNFAISDQVTVSINGQVVDQSTGRYVSGTGSVTGVESTVPAPQGVNLASLVHIDPATGVVTYDASQFAFLGVGESAIYTIGFDSQPGTSIVPETLTLTINGLNDKPTVEHPIPDQRAREGCRFEYVIPACVFADLDANDTLNFRATLANGDPLPSWLTFDPVSMTFSGTPPKGEECVLHIKVIASDEHNATAVDQFDIVIAESHQHHHHFHDDSAIALSGQDLTTVSDNREPVTGASDVASENQGEDCHKSEMIDSAGCSDNCSHESKPERDDRPNSSTDIASLSHREHVTYESNSGSGISDMRAHGSAQTPVPSNFDSDRSDHTEMHTGWSRSVVDYSSQMNSSHDNHSSFSTSYSVTFNWSSTSGRGRDADSFDFRSDLGRNLDHSHSTSDFTQFEKSWSGNGSDVAALVQAVTSVEFFASHDDHAITTRFSSSVELHTHQNDFHLT